MTLSQCTLLGTPSRRAKKSRRISQVAGRPEIVEDALEVGVGDGELVMIASSSSGRAAARDAGLQSHSSPMV